MGFFPESIHRCFPSLAIQVGRSRAARFLDKELRAVLGKSPHPRRYVDFLAEVSLKAGEPDSVLIHLEVQGSKAPGFASRMLVYHAALLQRFKRPVMSLAILADPNPSWRPRTLPSGVDGMGNRFEFPICKLSDFTDAELESDPNPVNLVILAERVRRRHRRDPVARREGKVALFRRMAVLMKSRRYSEEQRRVLTRVLDWSIPLPEAEELVFLEHLRQIQGDTPMTYLTTFERHALRKGMEQGLEQGLERGRHEGLERGLERGLEQGLERGRLEGRQKGRKEGRQEGREDGLRAGWVEAVKALATVRFPDWKPAWNRHLESLDDAEVLQDWLRRATVSPNGAAFLAAIGKRPERTHAETRRRGGKRSGVFRVES